MSILHCALVPHRLNTALLKNQYFQLPHCFCLNPAKGRET